MKPKPRRKALTADEKKVAAAFEQFRESYYDWALRAPNPFFVAIENKKIMAGWVAGKPVGG